MTASKLEHFTECIEIDCLKTINLGHLCKSMSHQFQNEKENVMASQFVNDD